MSVLLRALRASAILPLLLLAVRPAAAQRLGRTTITPAVLDRFVASYGAAIREDQRRNPGVTTMSFEAMNEAKDRWGDCKDSVAYATATATERATMERLQRAMQPYITNPAAPRAVALSDTATRLMHAVERRAEPKVQAACGLDPETKQQREIEASVEAPSFDVDSAAAAGMGVDGREWGYLRERIELFLEQSDARPNGLWTPAELAALKAYRAKLQAALRS